ncbi:outer membrane homotrimeric porin [Desulfovibrio sp. OttesenSCG-928-C06]|nr:outer membrane homotrimeric porin [Desulfovibrio sp. OttesenSCG-928-C06]
MKAKRLAALLLAGCMALGMAAQASALEVNVSGQMVYQFGIMDNYARGGGKFTDAEADHFFARQRVRLQIEFVASENLKGVLQIQNGTLYWGGDGAQLDTTSSDFKVRQAYIDWSVPDTGLNMKMGLQLLAMPHAVAGSPVLDSTVAAVVLRNSINENVSVGAFWARPYSNDKAAKLQNNNMDLFSILADFDYDSFRIQPWIMYGRVGSQSNVSSKWNNNVIGSNGSDDRYSSLYYGAVAASFTPIENLSINFDGIYGYLKNEASNIPNGDFEKSNGWMLALGADYDLGFGTLGAIAWYASGDDDGDVADGEYGKLPTISRGNSGFKPTRFGTAGSYAMGDDAMLTGTGAGTWGAGLHFKNFSFIEDLSHTVRAYYFNGTNDKNLYAFTREHFGDGMYLTTKDKGFELNLDSQYQVAKGFKIIWEIGYINMDWYKEKERGFNKDDIFNTQLTFDYRF